MQSRRDFLAAFAAATLTLGAKHASAELQQLPERMNLVPTAPSGVPNYWCTWAAQNYIYGQHLPALDIAVLEGDSGGRLAHEALDENVLLGSEGWARKFYPAIRNDLLLMLDDGWESGGTASFDLHTIKFPSFHGSSQQRLYGLRSAIERLGWKGLALWCRNTPGGAKDAELESLSVSAGIRYWKIDIGDPAFHLCQERRRLRLPLTLEHVYGELPVNGDWRKDGRFGAQPWDSRRIQIARATDVYRTYDVTSILSLPTTLDRVAEILHTTAGHAEVRGLLNVEDEVYVAAVLGCTMGVMRHPMYGMRTGADPDLFFNGARRAKQRLDEVVRAVRWQRIAAPFAMGVGSFDASSSILSDSWRFAPGQTWQRELIGQTVVQAAPAVLARNLELPIVTAIHEPPFVFAARFPNGAVAVGAQERTSTERAWQTPTCSIMLKVNDAPGPFGIFGSLDRLTLVFDRELGSRRILAQDLADDHPVEITHLVRRQGRELHFPNTVFQIFGRQSATPSDLSSPAFVVVLV